MPEGPSIVILREAAKPFSGKTIVSVCGNAKIDLDRLQGQKVTAIKSWGKHLLVCFKDFTVRIHLLMFGSYLVNENKAANIRLGLTFKNGFINFYACNVKLLEGNADEHYDWETDVMNGSWNPEKAKAKLREVPEMQVCDALLDQNIFAGVGNIIKNEVLYRIHLDPESQTGKLSEAKLEEMIREAQHYSFQFLDWKQKNELKKHWLAYTKKICQRCELPFVKAYTGTNKRRSFFCPNCQKLYQ